LRPFGHIAKTLSEKLDYPAQTRKRFVHPGKGASALA